MDKSKSLKKTPHPQKEQLTPRWKVWADKKLSSFKVQKLPPESKICPCEIPEELKTYVLENPDAQQVFIEPVDGEHDSEPKCCYKLYIKIHIKG